MKGDIQNTMTAEQVIKTKWYPQKRSVPYKEIKAHPNRYVLDTCYGDFDNYITVLIKNISIYQQNELNINAPVGKKYRYTIEIDWGDKGYIFVYANNEDEILIDDITGEIED